MSASAGRVMPLPKGVYNSETTYYILDIVRFGSGSFICKKTSLGNEPSFDGDTEYWMLIANSGAVSGVKGNAEQTYREGNVNIDYGDLGIDSAISSLSDLPVKNSVIAAALALKQDALTFDNTPAEGSNNPVTSDGIAAALDELEALIPTETGGSKITVTTIDSSLYGTNVSLTDGTTSMVEPFDNTGKAVFSGVMMIGDLTVSVLSGSSVTSVTFNTPYFGLYSVVIPPNGAIITPVNDVQTWLVCAGINDKNYTTISQVLADTTTLAALMLNHNAVDYLVRSTSWVSDITGDQTAMTDIGGDDYCADTLLADSTWLTAICNSTYMESVLNVKVPTMTSNTTPSGEAKAATVVDGSQYAYISFSGGTTGLTGSSGYIQYQFTAPVKIYLVYIKEYNNPSGFPIASFPKDVEFQVSNDGDTFTTVKSASMSGVTQGQEFKHNFSYEGQYSYFRMNILNNNGTSNFTQCGKPLQFYGRTSS